MLIYECSLQTAVARGQSFFFQVSIEDIFTKKYEQDVGCLQEEGNVEMSDLRLGQCV